MKTLNYIIFWVLSFVIVTPVLLAIMSDSVVFVICALVWSALWYCFFTKTKRGKRMFLRGYKMAAHIMSDC